METILAKSIRNSQAISSVAYGRALQIKAEGFASGLFGGSQFDFVTDSRSHGVNREGRAAYRGWLYSAIHALASKAAGQPVNVGKLATPGKTGPKSSKFLGKVPLRLQSKSARQEFEMLIEHPLLSVLEHPNPFQHRWQFVNSFVASLNLTGWSYVVGGDDGQGGVEFFALPTSWVKPNADFSVFKIADPAKGFSEGITLPKENVSFAYLPDPENPHRAISPATSQIAAIRIDDKIQSSQAQFFDNAIFPSALITMGEKPLGNDGPTNPPVLTATQRRQMHLAVSREWKGVSNYGRPAILDGWIKSITRFGANQNEIGWEKSEDKVKQRIFSSFGINPIILGEQVAGSYAQAYVVQQLFYDRVNTNLDMLDVVMSKFVDLLFPEEKLEIWWTPAEATDPSIESKAWEFGRKNNDVSQNEYRTRLGLPPDEDHNEANIIGPMGNQVMSLLNMLGIGNITPDQAVGTLIEMGLSTSSAERIAGLASVQATLGLAIEELNHAVATLKTPTKLLEHHEGNIVDV